jgi:hypothetical protein
MSHLIRSLSRLRSDMTSKKLVFSVDPSAAERAGIDNESDQVS